MVRGQTEFIRTDFSQVTEYLKALEDPKLYEQAVIDGMKAGSLVLRIFMAENLSGRLINVDTGALRRSIFVDDPKALGDAIVLVYGSQGVPYAAIHEFGGASGVGGLAIQTEKRMFRDAGERALPGIVQQIGIHALRAMSEAA